MRLPLAPCRCDPGRNLTRAPHPKRGQSMTDTGNNRRYSRVNWHSQAVVTVGGSDAHSLLTVGRAYTEIRVDQPIPDIESDDVVAAIRSGDTAIQGQRASLKRSTGHYAKAAGRKTAWGAKTAAKKSSNGAQWAVTTAIPFL